MAVNENELPRCPVTGDPIQLQILGDGKGKAKLCRIHTRFWTSAVFSAKTAALRWVGEVCADFDTFMDGAEVYARELVLSPSPDPRTFYMIRNPKKEWSCTGIKASSEKDAWYALTKRPEYAPPKVEVVRDETDFEYRLDDAVDDMVDSADPDIDELIDYAQEAEAKKAKERQ